MKGITRFLSIVLLICMLAVSFAACADQEIPNGDPDSNPSQTDPDGETDLDGETDPEPDATPEPIPPYDLTKYSIVYPSAVDISTSVATSLLQNLLKTKGLQLTVGNDSYLGESTETSYEILVGDTNRAASSEALKSIESEKGYVIQFFENQIVIQANVEQALEKAVTYFVNTYVSEGNSYVVDAKAGDWYACVQRQLAQSGSFGYQIVVSDEASTSVQNMATTLKSRLQSLTGMAVTVAKDTAYDKNATEIVIGATAYSESTVVRNAMKINQYGIHIQNNKIVVNGHHEKTVLLAAQALIDLLQTNTTVSGGHRDDVCSPQRYVRVFRVAGQYPRLRSRNLQGGV